MRIASAQQTGKKKDESDTGISKEGRMGQADSVNTSLDGDGAKQQEKKFQNET